MTPNSFLLSRSVVKDWRRRASYWTLFSGLRLAVPTLRPGLKFVRSLCEKHAALKQSRHQAETDQLASLLLQENDLLDRICGESNEFYYLLPKPGHLFEKVPPVDSVDRVKEERKRLQFLSEFETSKSFILGAMLRQDEKHPLDYIYSALNCSIEILEEKSEEAQLLMKYLYRSRGAASRRVEAIYQVQRPAGQTRLLERAGGAGKLLWHGTRASNLLSILHGGLLPEAPHAQHSGSRFGAGIYFADIFDKESFPTLMSKLGEKMIKFLIIHILHMQCHQ